MDKIGIPENMEYVKTIILNGKVEYVKTCDENYETIGVVVRQQVKRLNGTVEEAIVDSFPFTKRMADDCDWARHFVNIQMLTGDSPIDMDHIDETKVVSMIGDVKSHYYHRYSEISGYLWTEEVFKCGGHDLKQILESHHGEYIHIEIELYREKRRRWS